MWRGCEVWSSAPARTTALSATPKNSWPPGASTAPSRWRARSPATSTWRISPRSTIGRGSSASATADRNRCLSRWRRASARCDPSWAASASSSSSRRSRSNRYSRRTAARRRAVVTAIRRVGDQLERLDDPRISDTERMDAERRLIEEIDGLWRTAQVRTAHVEPLDEVRSLMAVFDETLFRIVPELMRALDDAVAGDRSGRGAPVARPFLRFGSWVGGDRDGNPTVTARVTAETMRVQAEHALLALETAATRTGPSR